MGACIIGSGKAIPTLDIENDELSALVETDDEWISTRTGIKSRRIALEESTLDLAIHASRCAMGLSVEENSGIESVHAYGEEIDPDSIDLLIFPTITSDTIVPSSAASLKAALGLSNAIAFDINAACSGFIYGLSVAESMMAASNNETAGKASLNKIKRALIVCSERLTRITDWTDRSTCVLFGDGAGAAVVEWQDDPSTGVQAIYLKNDDDVNHSLTCMNQFVSMQPFCEEGIDASSDTVDLAQDSIDEYYEIVKDGQSLVEDNAISGKRQVLRMDGQTVFKFATRAMCSAVKKVVIACDLTRDDIKLIIPHQANERIISYAAKRLQLPLEKFQVSIAHTGNTSSSGEPMALADAFVEGKIGKGDYIVLVAFGGGLTSGAALVKI